MGHPSAPRYAGARRALVVLAGLAAAACQSASAPPAAGRVGVVDFYGDGQAGVIEVPSTRVRAGQDLPVTIRTFGNACVSAAGASLTYRGGARVAVIVPYDDVREGMCPDVLVRPARVVVVRFATPGPATIRVEGRREPGGGTAVVELPVTVTSG